MSKFVTEEIKKIEAIVTAGIQKIEQSSEEEYNAMRLELNMHVIQTLIGGEVATKKDGSYKIKFNKPLPSMVEVATIAGLVDKFYQAEMKQCVGYDDDDDMSIPEDTNMIQYTKMNQKELQGAVLGAGGFASMMINGTDCITIAGIGKETRKKANFHKALIIGGISVAIIGAATAGCIIYKKKHKDDDIIDAEVVDIEAEPIELDVPVDIDLDVPADIALD